jgi:UDP-N-acetylglucosamine 2-epimerase (non-hydrolysing)
MKLALVLGTRPEIIKLAPIINKLNKKNSSVIFTGQHYDYELSLQFFKQLEIRKPDYSLEISRSKPAVQMGEIISKLPAIFDQIKPDTVVVQGDTNTVLAASISSLKCGIPISHVEAGLRSFDWRMPEEHNRIVTDHISELLFAPTSVSKGNLLSEKVHGRIFVTGNTVLDAINAFVGVSAQKADLNIDLSNFVLMTLHRAENVDDRNILSSIISAILDSKQTIVLPLHPRTQKRLKQFGLYEKFTKSKNIKIIKSVGYFEMLELMKKCSFIITDSGGIQEEATSPKIRKKVVIVRKTTDRPETVTAGFSMLAGLSYSGILSAIKKTAKDPKLPKATSPYGTGRASAQIIKSIRRHIG